MKEKNNTDTIDNLLTQVEEIIYFTSGQCLIFDINGQQISELQKELCIPRHGNINLLKQVAEHANKFHVGKFREWMQDVDKDDFFTLTNLYAI